MDIYKFKFEMLMASIFGQGLKFCSLMYVLRAENVKNNYEHS